MKTFNFEVFLVAADDSAPLQVDEFLDRVEDPLFEAFEGDVTPAVRGGLPVLYCTIDADSIGEALDRVAGTVVRLGLHSGQVIFQLDQYELV